MIVFTEKNNSGNVGLLQIICRAFQTGQSAMVAVISSANTTALAVLSSQDKAGRAVGFMTSAKVSFYPPSILIPVATAFTKNRSLQDEFAKAFEKEKSEMAALGLMPTSNNLRHGALLDVIAEHRSEFPHDSFSIKTELGNGASIETFIPAYIPALDDPKSTQPPTDEETHFSIDPKQVALARITETLALDNAPSENLIALNILESKTDTDASQQKKNPYAEV